MSPKASFKFPNYLLSYLCTQWLCALTFWRIKGEVLVAASVKTATKIRIHFCGPRVMWSRRESVSVIWMMIIWSQWKKIMLVQDEAITGVQGLYIHRFNTGFLVQCIAFEEACMINKFSLWDIWMSSTMSAWKEQGQRHWKSNQGEDLV